MKNKIINRVTVFLAALSFCSCAENNTQKINTSTMTNIEVTIDHYAINVEDLKRSVDFYQDIFGLEEIENGTGKSNIRWLRLGATQELHIIEVDSLDKKVPKGVHLALAVRDFDRFRNRIDERNLEYSDWPGAAKAISIRPDKVRQLYFQDPDGYWVEVNDAKQF